MPTMKQLAEANLARQHEWDPNDLITLEFRGNELAGEVGEACNIIKKLARERMGLRGSRAVLNDLAEELADVIICVNLIAVTEGIDMDKAVISKFNATSAEYNLSVMLSEQLVVHSLTAAPLVTSSPESKL